MQLGTKEREREKDGGSREEGGGNKEFCVYSKDKKDGQNGSKNLGVLV